MSIYGQGYRKVSYQDYYYYMVESNFEIESMFERTNLIVSITEANDGNVKIPENAKSDSKGFIIKISEKIKELFSKLKSLIVNLFEKLQDKMYEISQKFNFTDNYYVKAKPVITLDNMQAARDKGWKGLYQPLINKIADSSDSALISSTLYEKYIDALEKQIETITRSETADRAIEIYYEFQDKLESFKQSKSVDSALSIFMSNRFSTSLQADLSRSFKDKAGEIEAIMKMFFIHPMSNGAKDDDGYIPQDGGSIAIKAFATTINLATEGQQKIKELKNISRKVIKDLKLDSQQDGFLNNANSYKKGGSNYTNDPDTNKINMYYWKAKYDLASAICQRKAAIVKSIVNLIKIQYSVAMSTYRDCMIAVKHYLPEEWEKTGIKMIETKKEKNRLEGNL